MANEFDAFISYSRAADGDLAPALQAGLQRLAKPWSQRRALEVFRDETGLAVTPDLWASITEALDSSRWFILLASPQAAASRWVGQEIERWTDNDPSGAERILPVLTSGRLEWDPDAGDWSADSDAVPDALRGRYEHEPRYIDLTWIDEATLASESLDLDHPAFRQAVAEIAAPIHGVSQDDLIGDDVRQHRTATRLRRIAVASLVVLTLGAVVASLFAVRSERNAQRNASEALSRSLAALSDSTLEEDPELATLLAVESLIEGRSIGGEARRDGERAMTNALTQLLNTPVNPIGSSIDVLAIAVAVSPDGSTLATLDQDGLLRTWDPATGSPLLDAPIETAPTRAPPLEPTQPARQIAFDPAGERVLVWSDHESVPEPEAVYLVDVAAQSADRVATSGPAAWLPDGSFVTVDDGATLRRHGPGPSDPTELSVAIGTDVATLLVTAGGSLVAVDVTNRAHVLDDELTDVARTVPLDQPIEGTVSNTIWVADPIDEILHVHQMIRPDSEEAERVQFWITPIDVGPEADDGSSTDTTAPQRFDYPLNPVADGTMAFALDGSYLAVVDGELQQGLSGADADVAQSGTFVEIHSQSDELGRPAAIRIPTTEATDVVWMPSGGDLVIASLRGVETWRVNAMPDAAGATAMTGADDGSTVATWDRWSGVTTVFDVNGRPRHRIAAAERESDASVDEPIRGVLGFDAPGRLIIGGRPGLDGLDLVDPVAGEPLEWSEGAAAPNVPFSISPSGELAATGWGEIIDLSSGLAVHRLDVPPEIVDLRWSSEQSIVAITATGQVSRFDVESGDRTDLVSDPRLRLTSLDADGGTVVVGDARGRLLLVSQDPEDPETLQTIGLHTSLVTSVDVVGGDRAISAGGTLTVRSLPGGELLWSSADVPAMGDRGWWLAAGLADGSIMAAQEFAMAHVAAPDVDRACRSVDRRAFDRLRDALDRDSSCVELLDDETETTGPSPPATLPPVITAEPIVTVAPTITVSPSVTVAPTGDSAPTVDVTRSAVGLTDEAIAENCPDFVPNEELPLREGERGQNVAFAQELIIARAPDFVDIEVTGCFDGRTRYFVLLLQAGARRSQTGVLDETTWNQLLAGT